MSQLTKVKFAQIHNLSQKISQATDFETVLDIALTQICHSTDWNYAEIWIPDEDNKNLVFSPIWGFNIQNSDDLVNLEQFRMCSEGFILLPGQGLPGRVWLSQQPEWLLNASDESEKYFLRNQIAQVFNIKTGFGIPIVYNNQVLSIIVFFMLEICEFNQRIAELTIKMVRQIEKSLGQFY
ncbi:GAF domain-containing protein [Dolichospermum sp. UHCC 0259]|uniref:GAF domain-containing protein n=1 Tax=Dolichospermum sp. UHCC 0259 TaxID=2590010 RepID=UPI0014485E62|nr:GAF domain-containing protein [Dolichospermum sp. UHCC 0259]MTJ49694.1 GAF domain-containing protein [Dolichospermum sp. UHCC 0259]